LMVAGVQAQSWIILGGGQFGAVVVRHTGRVVSLLAGPALYDSPCFDG
jgi:hypothetical protein